MAEWGLTDCNICAVVVVRVVITGVVVPGIVISVGRIVPVIGVGGIVIGIGVGVSTRQDHIGGRVLIYISG